MKIGIFDSGVGGLIITHALINALPEYDYLFLGDTARVPYGNRPPEEIDRFTEEGVRYLFEQDCGLVIIACNTASAETLRQLQQGMMRTEYPGRHLLGVLIPAAEEAVERSRGEIGVLATEATVKSGAYLREINKLDPDITVIQEATPTLVPLVEGGDHADAGKEIQRYLDPLLEQGVDTLILGCTHYPYLKDQIRILAGGMVVVSQDEIIPQKLASYLTRHPALTKLLSRTGERIFQVTALSPTTQRLADRLFGEPVPLHYQQIYISKTEN